jgi:hypothetical protein
MAYQSTGGKAFGEALFDVVKDVDHPFIVTTSTISIKVLGTKFNVRAYNNDKTSEASLIRGRIELTILKTPEKKSFYRHRISLLLPITSACRREIVCPCKQPLPKKYP